MIACMVVLVFSDGLARGRRALKNYYCYVHVGISDGTWAVGLMLVRAID